MARIDLDTRRGYDRWSEIYDDDPNPLPLLDEPVVRGWLASPAGLRVADVGCGTGRHARWLAEQGARVTGFDGSPGMIEKARAKLAGLGVEVVPHSLPAPLPARDGAFDAVLFTLVADHLEDLVGGFRELRRVTRVGGEVVFTVLHPALHILGVSARFTDPTSGDEVRVAAFDHGYGDYVMGVLGSGLAIEEIVERAADQALAERAPRAAKYLGWPLLLAMRLRRVA